MINVHFNEVEALRRFDRLVNIGVIKYTDAAAVALFDKGFKYTIRVCDGWKTKPAVVGASTTDTNGPAETFGPGSDITNSHPEQTVGQLNGTHTVALNIYPAFRPQYLLLTVDSYRSQYEPLQYEDISASWAFLNSLSAPHMALYNCTPEAGCSRMHKHVQVLPCPNDEQDTSGRQGFRLFPDRTDGDVCIPYAYFLHRFTQDSRPRPSAREVFGSYTKLLGKTRACLGISAGDTATPCPHNVILVRDWLLVIPRRRDKSPSLMTNGAGMIGIIITSTAEQAQQWMDKGVSAALAECGLAPPAPEDFER